VENNISPAGTTPLSIFRNNTSWRGTNDPTIGPGAKLKASSPLWNGTNASGFTVLPAGSRTLDGIFGGLGSGANFWSASESSSADAWCRYFGTNAWQGGRDGNPKPNGFSLRCLQN